MGPTTRLERRISGAVGDRCAAVGDLCVCELEPLVDALNATREVEQ